MPTLPWTTRTALEPDHEYVVMASRLPLKSLASTFSFMRGTLQIRNQLKEAPGLVGYTLKADVLSKTYWTFSAWTDEQSLKTFAVSDPHAAIIKHIRPLMGDTQFEFLTAKGADLPWPWKEITPLVS